MRSPLPEVAVVVSFIDAINHGDVERLAALMAPDHCLQVLDEAPLDGKDANVAAWHGYASSFPHYVIHPHRIGRAHDGAVVVLGHTTGSHLGLPDEEEAGVTVIWRALVRDGLLTRWEIIEETPPARTKLGLD